MFKGMVTERRTRIKVKTNYYTHFTFYKIARPVRTHEVALNVDEQSISTSMCVRLTKTCNTCTARLAIYGG